MTYELMCTPRMVERNSLESIFSCHYEDCNDKFKTAQQLRTHAAEHTWVLTSCKEEGCEDLHPFS